MSDASVAKRQHVVNLPVRPLRTPAGDTFTDLVVEVATLGAMFTAKGEALARLGGQSLARWVILDAAEASPSTVAQIARQRGIARQAVQRVADVLERDGLIAYEPNPAHRRAKLVRPTAAGQDALRSINEAQRAWADLLGQRIGEAELQRTRTVVLSIRRAVQEEATQPSPSRRRRS